MPRGYRCVLIAAFGWLSLAATIPPDSRAKGNQSAASANVEHSLDSIAKSQAEAVKNAEPGEYQKPCEPGGRNYNSDLCAQWYAAIAAGEAAKWAYWAVVWSVISLVLSAAGLIGLLLSLRQTNRALKIAFASHEMDYKPYLIPDASGVYTSSKVHPMALINGTVKSFVIMTKVCIKNSSDNTAIVFYSKAGPILSNKISSIAHRVYVSIEKDDFCYFNIGGVYKDVNRVEAGFATVSVPDDVDQSFTVKPPPVAVLIRYSDPLGTRREMSFAFQSGLAGQNYERWGGETWNYDRKI